MAQPLTVSMVCPTCGRQLVGPKGTRAQLSDTLSSTEHGAVGRFGNASRFDRPSSNLIRCGYDRRLMGLAARKAFTSATNSDC
jgi:hypothetical protein